MAAVRQVGTFDDGLIEHVEHWLEYAFTPASRRGDSPIAQFDGRKRDKKASVLKLKNTSTEWSRRHQASETRAAQFSKPLLQPEDWDNIAIVRAVNELPELALCWVKFKYMPPSVEQFNYSARFGRMFWMVYQARFESGSRADVQNTVKRLVDTLIICENNPLLRTMMASAKPWEVFKIERTTWYATYRSHWTAIKSELRQIHCEALMGVYGKLS